MKSFFVKTRILFVALALVAFTMISCSPDKEEHETTQQGLTETMTVDNPIENLFWWLMCQEGSKVCPEE